MDPETQAITAATSAAYNLAERAKRIAANMRGVRNLTGPLALQLADDMMALGLDLETLAANVKFDAKQAAARLAR